MSCRLRTLVKEEIVTVGFEGVTGHLMMSKVKLETKLKQNQSTTAAEAWCRFIRP